MKQRARAGHQRVYQAVPVDESCPPQLVVTRSTVLEDARRHRTSTQCTSEASTKCLPSSCDRHCQPKLLGFEICFRFLKVPSLSTRAVPNSSSSHVLMSSSQPRPPTASPACLSSHPRRRELSPTARRRPLYCSQRSSPTLLQTQINGVSAEQLRLTPPTKGGRFRKLLQVFRRYNHRQQPGYSSEEP